MNKTFNIEDASNVQNRITNRLGDQYTNHKNNSHELQEEKEPILSQPKPYLKRGSGLARFNLPTDPKKQPSRVKKKQPMITNVKSKYNQETEAFKNKKANTRKTLVLTPENKVQTLNVSRPSSVSKYMKLPSKRTSIREPEPSLKLIWNKTKGRKEKNSVSHLSAPIRQTSICDSVEHSFREKLSIQERRQANELKELEVFKILEDATLDSSFNRLGHLYYHLKCSDGTFFSSSSRINTLVHNSMLPSPTKERCTEEKEIELTNNRGGKQHQTV